MKARLVTSLLGICLLFACNKENAPDCFQRSGDIINVELDVTSFDRIEIWDQFEVVFKDGPEQKVELQIGSNLLEEIIISVQNGQLVIMDNNGCGWVRGYDFPVLTVTHPAMAEIVIKGASQVRSEGILQYPSLKLVSQGVSGDFNLEVESNVLWVVNSQLVNYTISGTVGLLQVGYYAGDGRFEGGDLIAQEVEVFHRGTNDIIVQAMNSLVGEIVFLGDVVYVKNQPPTVDITRNGPGQVIFQP